MSNTSIEDIIRMREEVIRSLVDEKKKLQHELESIHIQIVDIDTNLQRLGYSREPGTHTTKATRSSRKPSRANTLEMLLEDKEPVVISLYHTLSEKIVDLGPGIYSKPWKKYVAFGVKKNFCEVVVWASKLTIYLDIPISDLDDPEKITEDCSEIGRWTSGATRFHLHSSEDIEYAIKLIKQSYQYNI